MRIKKINIFSVLLSLLLIFAYPGESYSKNKLDLKRLPISDCGTYRLKGILKCNPPQEQIRCAIHVYPGSHEEWKVPIKNSSYSLSYHDNHWIELNVKFDSLQQTLEAHAVEKIAKRALPTPNDSAILLDKKKCSQ